MDSFIKRVYVDFHIKRSGVLKERGFSLLRPRGSKGIYMKFYKTIWEGSSTVLRCGIGCV